MVIPTNAYDVPAHIKARNAAKQQYSMDTRTGGRAKVLVNSSKVIVDVREFRSALPSMLHKEGLILSPVTLEIGDFILSPRICVERKSVSDLFGSFASGRLFNQADNMSRYYEVRIILFSKYSHHYFLSTYFPRLQCY